MKNKRFIFTISCIIILLILMQSAVVFAGEYVTLKFGSRGPEVVRLQNALINKRYLWGPADGIYGKYTERAVIKYQQDYGLIIDGIAGRQTQTALFGSPTVSRATTVSNNQQSPDVYWMSRIIHAEARGESYKGKVAVGNVILNRVRSPQFPNTVYGVIFEYYKGIPQFCPVADGTIYNTPDQESINAAIDAINGYRPVGEATYFFNPAKSHGNWIVNNKNYVTRIGNHVFYK